MRTSYRVRAPGANITTCLHQATCNLYTYNIFYIFNRAPKIFNFRPGIRIVSPEKLQFCARLLDGIYKWMVAS